MTGTSSRLLLAAALGAGSLIAGCAIACTTPAASGALMRLASPATPTATPNTTVPPKLWGPILPEPPVEDPQISAYVREVYQDRAGHYWFGTNGDGVARFDGTSLTYPSFGPGFDGLAVRGIDQHADGSMWFATDAGVTRIAGDTITNFTMKDGLSSIQVWSLMIDRAGTVWAGTHEGVCRFDGTAFVSFPLPRIAVATPESRFTPKVVFAMEEDAAGHLWFGTDGEGVHRFDGAGFTSFSQADGLGSNMVRSLRSDRAGRMWVGTDGGGVSVLESGRWRTLTMADGLNNDRIFEILEDRAGRMWFSTLGAGASRWDGRSFTSFGSDEGLSTNELPCPCGSGKKLGECHGPNPGAHVQEFLEDREGRIWFGCSGGLFRLEGDRVINITKDGPWPAIGSATSNEEPDDAPDRDG